MLEGLRFEPNEPIDTIFTEIDNYAEICALTNSPLSNKQQIDFGYILILKMLKYKSALRKWNELPAADKTYDNMKTVFRKAQRAIRKTGEITVQEGLNHTELVNFVSEGVFQAMGETERLSQEPTIELEERANAATNVPDYATEMAEMREMLKAMQQMVIQCSNPTNNNNQVQHQTQQQMLQNGMVPIPLGDITALLQNTTTTNNNNYRRRGGRGGRGGRGYVARTGKYCWTHGGCNHFGSTCETKAQGHKDEATFQNKMGGSTKNCSN